MTTQLTEREIERLRRDRRGVFNAVLRTEEFYTLCDLALQALRSQPSGWVKCSERLPEEHGSYLVSYQENEFGPVIVADDRWYGNWWVDTHVGTVSHWQPLPKPPGQQTTGPVLEATVRETVVVPREPTEAMVIAGNDAISSPNPNRRTVSAIYKAMLSAAPSSQDAGSAGEGK